MSRARWVSGVKGGSDGVGHHGVWTLWSCVSGVRRGV